MSTTTAIRKRSHSRPKLKSVFPPLPPHECQHGYTDAEIRKYLRTSVQYENFCYYMHGQTMSICEGRLYNHETESYEPDECANNPHGIVTYAWDLRRYTENLPPYD